MPGTKRAAVWLLSLATLAGEGCGDVEDDAVSNRRGRGWLLHVEHAGEGGAGASACPLGTDQRCEAKFELNGYDRGHKTAINTCVTNASSSPCAWADVNEKVENFLACSLKKTGPIALCYHSGVPGAPLYTPACTLSQAGNAAQCDCYEIRDGDPSGATYSYVLITSILNQRVYEDTVAACGIDGSLCRNATDLDNPKEAPVCEALGKTGRYPEGLFPGADLISDFSPSLAPTLGITNHDCGPNVYAGCMTAPCKRTGKTDRKTGLPLVKCTCPTYDGPNNVGNPQIDADNSCSPSPRVWSSAYGPSFPTQ
jgi:hypothetical protein